MMLVVARALILANGRLKTTARFLKEFRAEDFDFAIAADGGARHAIALNVPVSHWLGDFDSSQNIQTNASVLRQASQEKHSPHKDLLDTELALLRAKDLGATSALVLGALGGRFDHALALALVALRHAQQGFFIELDSGDEHAWPLVPGSHEFAFWPGQTFSILAIEELQGLSVQGARWPLSNATMQMGTGWGVSNVALKNVKVSLAAGAGLLIAQDNADEQNTNMQ